jgi:hypothetical protein
LRYLPYPYLLGAYYARSTTLPGWVCFAVGVAGLLAILLIAFVVRRALRSSAPDPPDIQLPIETGAVHAGPLPYRNPLDERRRPGILTAVAVISIVVGCFGVLGNLLGLLSTFSQSAVGVTTSTFVTTASGTVVSVGPAMPATTNATTMSTTTFTVPPPPPMRIIVLAVLNDLLHLGLAGYLIAIGILMLRDSRHSRTQHLAYACFKLMLVGVAIWTNWAWYSTKSATLFGGPGIAVIAIVVYLSVIFVAPGVIYPIALLIVMNTRAVKAYYRTWASSKLNEA